MPLLTLVPESSDLVRSIVLITFAAYLAAMIAIGLWSARKKHEDAEDYFLAGRSLGPWVTALSAVSSGRSSWLIVGITATAWAAGLSTLWMFPGYILAEALIFVSIGPRLRQRSIVHGAITLPEALDTAEIGSRGLVRRVAGVVTILFMVSYTGAQLLAGGKTLSVVTDVSGDTWGLVISAGIVLVYTVLGGYRAVAMTDVIQSLLMLLSLLAVPLLALRSLGGFAGLAEALRAIDPNLLEWRASFLPWLGAVGIGLGSFGNPHILVRHMSLRDPSEARRAAVIGTCWNVVMAAGALLLGLCGRALYPTVADLGGDPDHLFATLSSDLSTELLGPVALGLLLASLFAAVMSTCDSQLLVVASSLLRDVLGRREGKGLGSARVTVAVALGLAVALTWGAKKLVGPFVLYAWAALGAAFGAPLILLLYDRRTTATGIVAGILTGVAVTIAWDRTEALEPLVYELVPGFVAAGLVTFALRSWRTA